MEIYQVSSEEYSSLKLYDPWIDGAFFEDAHTIEIWRNSSGLIHRQGGPAIVVSNTLTNKISAEGWFAQGRLHRDADLPAGTIKDGLYIQYSWYRHGLLHRENGPADVLIDPHPVPKYLHEKWFKDGQRHRIGGPDSIHISAWGVVEIERWAVDGKSHREEGPSYVARDERTGTVLTEGWALHGRPHRETGPATVQRDKHGEITHVSFFRHGVETDNRGIRIDKQGASPLPL